MMLFSSDSHDDWQQVVRRLMSSRWDYTYTSAIYALMHGCRQPQMCLILHNSRPPPENSEELIISSSQALKFFVLPIDTKLNVHVERSNFLLIVLLSTDLSC